MVASKQMNQLDLVKIGTSQVFQVERRELYTARSNNITHPIFQSSNQGGSIIPWSYYPTTHKHVLVSARVLFSVYHFDRMIESFAQLVSGYYKCPPIYTRYMGAQIHTQCSSADMQMWPLGLCSWTHDPTRGLITLSRYHQSFNHTPIWQATWGLKTLEHVSNLDWLDCF